MLSYDQLVAAVRAEGVNLSEVFLTSGGKTYNSRNMCRCHSGEVHQTAHQTGGSFVRSYNPDGTVIVHITAGDLGSRTPLQYILDILLTNPNAPLAANFSVYGKQAWILSAGRTNHDLNMSQAAFNALKGDAMSLDGYQDLRGSGVDPKAFTYGIENISSTSLDNHPDSYETSVRIVAGISRAYKRSGRNTAGHGEVAIDRSFADPGINMGTFRRATMARVAGTALPPPTVQEDFMSELTAYEQRDLYNTAKAIQTALIIPGYGGATYFQALINQGNDERKLLDELAAAIAADDGNSVNVDPAALAAALVAALRQLAADAPAVPPADAPALRALTDAPYNADDAEPGTAQPELHG